MIRDGVSSVIEICLLSIIWFVTCNVISLFSLSGGNLSYIMPYKNFLVQ